MLISPLLLLLVLIVGMMIGSVGIGGVLQVPILHVLGGVPIHTVIPACMLAYLLPGAIGGLIYYRHGNLDTSCAWRICLGAIPGAFLGTWLLPLISMQILQFLVALMVLFSGVDVLIQRREKPGRVKKLGGYGFMAAGLVTGIISALTGAGGPLALVPILVWFKVPIRLVVGLGQFIQIPISLMATLGNLRYGMVDLELSLWLAVTLSVGVLVGGWAAHRLPEQKLKKAVAVLLTLVGGIMLIRWMLL